MGEKDGIFSNLSCTTVLILSYVFPMWWTTNMLILKQETLTWLTIYVNV